MNTITKVPSQRGEENIIVDGYRYGIRKSKCTILEKSWLCIEKRCNISINTNSQCTAITYRSNGKHIHPPNESKSVKYSLVVMKDRCCRLCMSKKNLCDMDISIRNCIESEYSIEISEEDSKLICQQCLEFVTEVMKFRERVDGFGDMVIRSQKLLHKILNRKYTRTDSNLMPLGPL